MNIFLMAYKMKSESQAAFGTTFRQLSESRNKLLEEGYWKYSIATISKQAETLFYFSSQKDRQKL
jgi:hypothetical protein